MARSIGDRDALSSRQTLPAAEAAAELLDLSMKLRKSQIDLVRQSDVELQASEAELDAGVLQSTTDEASRRVAAGHCRGNSKCRVIGPVGRSVGSLADHIDLRGSIDAEADSGSLDLKHMNGGADFGDQNPFVQTARQDEHGTVPFRERECIRSTGE
jgi:hypothetical protein